MPDIADFAKATVDASAPFWAAEYEIACRYFGGAHARRSDESEVRWIEHQMYKEWFGSGVYGPPGVHVMSLIRDAAARAERMNEAGDLSDVDAVLGTLKFATDELRHYKHFRQMRSLLTDEPPAPMEEDAWLPEGAKLTALRYEQRRDPVGLIAVHMSESGGLGLYYGIADTLGYDPTDHEDDLAKSIVSTSVGIIADESSHLGFNFRRRVVEHLSETQWDELRERLRAISRQKLLERNEQFGGVLDDRDLSAVERGETDWKSYARLHLGFWYDKLDIPLERLP